MLRNITRVYFFPILFDKIYYHGIEHILDLSLMEKIAFLSMLSDTKEVGMGWDQ